MRMSARWALLVSLTPIAAATAVTPAELNALIECRARLSDFIALRALLTAPARTDALGWRALPTINPFMTEYALNRAIDVFGHPTSRIAFASDSVMAVLDQPDPRPLARRLGLHAALDTPKKVLYGREVLSLDVTVPGQSQNMIESIVLSVSNVDSHPNKTLVGCGYSLDLP